VQIILQAQMGPRPPADKKRVVPIELEVLALVRAGSDFEGDPHGLPLPKLGVARHPPVPEMDSDMRIIPRPSGGNKNPDRGQGQAEG
jgi:hypothetical protein